VPFAAALSHHPDAAVAAGEAIGQCFEGAGPEPDLAVVFVTPHHLGAFGAITSTIQATLEPRHLLGASAVAVLGGGHGIEGPPGLALWVGRFRGTIETTWIRAERSEGGYAVRGLDPARLDRARTLLVVADPYSLPLDGILAHLGRDHPNLRVIGGLASAPGGPGVNRLVIDGRVVDHGAVGVLLDVDAAPATVVSQGCRPVGQPFTVTAAEGNVVVQLGGRPALQRLYEVLDGLDPIDRAAFARGPQCGIVVDDAKLDYERGDFVIRGIVGIDRDRGTVAVGDTVPVGATVQFQVRDAASAGEDLAALLAPHAADAALVFTCNGRGAHLFGTADHDPALVQDLLGPRAAVAGMFCAGELGPIGRRNVLHGFTASVALFRDTPGPGDAAA
jgi:small ligand-binding sensory domain FIST